MSAGSNNVQAAGAWWTLLTLLLLLRECPFIVGSGWSYDEAEGDGPSVWYKNYPACGGTSQSPIDISSSVVVNLDPEFLSFYPASLPVSPLTFLNNGHSLQLSVAPRLLRLASSTFPNLMDAMQFHFHTPSEHTVNGKYYDMECHLVFNSSNRLALGPLAPLVVVGVLFQIGSTPSPLLEQLLPYLPSLSYANNSTLASIIPDFPNVGTQFWTYNGSLTTPPCYEIVSWLVSTTIHTATREQIEAFAAIMKENARPTQPLNGRKVAKRPLVPQNVDNYFSCPSYPTCGSASLSCPIVSVRRSSSTLCAQSPCTQEDCCGAATVIASTYLSIVLAMECSALTQTSVKQQIQAATGVPVTAVIITHWGCSSTTIYMTTLGSSAALADAALNLISQTALSGALGPVISVGVVTTAGPVVPSITTTAAAATTAAYLPTYPLFPATSSSNPALFALFALLAIPLLIFIGLLISFLRRKPAPVPACPCPVMCPPMTCLPSPTCVGQQPYF